MSLKLDGKKLSLEIEERLNDYISNNKKIAKIYNISSDELDQIWSKGEVKNNTSEYYTFEELDKKLGIYASKDQCGKIVRCKPLNEYDINEPIFKKGKILIYELDERDIEASLVVIEGLVKEINSKELPKVLDNLGIAIMSTSKGVMTYLTAKELGIGGEVLCYIW